jgi:chemotaxis-related protein WspB
MPGDEIIKVVPDIPLESMTTATSYVVGVFNYAGVPIPVIDFGLLMQKTSCQKALHTRLIIIQSIVEGKPCILGVRAEKVTAVFEVDINAFQQEVQAIQPWPFLGGVYSTDRMLLQLVKGDVLLKWYYQQAGLVEGRERIVEKPDDRI